MAIRFDATADGLVRTTDILPYTTETVMFWVNLASDRNAVSVIFKIFDNTGNNEDRIRTTSAGTVIQLRSSIAGANTSVNGSNLTVGTWYHVAMRRSSPTLLELFLNGVLDITNTRDVTGRTAATRMEFVSEATDTADVRVFAAKAWTVALSDAEINNERWTVRPVHQLQNLYAWWPFLPGSGERVRDYSGNGRSWTEEGTLTDEDHPPVSWGGSWQFISRAAGTLYTSSPVGTLTSAGSLTKKDQKVLAGVLTSSGALTKAARKVLAGALSFSGSLTRKGQKVLSGSLSPAGALLKRAGKALSGAISPAGALSVRRLYFRALSGTLNSAGSLSRKAGKSLSGTLASVGVLSRKAKKVLAGAVSPAGTVAGDIINLFHQSAGGTLSFSGSLIKEAHKALSGSLSPSGALTRKIRKNLAGVLTFTGGLTKTIRRLLAGALSFVGVVSGQSSGAVTGTVNLTLNSRTVALTLSNRATGLSINNRTVVLTLEDR